MIMDRPSKEIVLPISKLTVGVYLYYLREDTVAIQMIMAGATEFDEAGNVVKVHAGYTYGMDNEAVLRGIKYIKDGDKDVPKNMKTVNSLPADDFDFLKEALPKGAKKKSTTKPLGGSSKQRQKKGE